MFNSIRILNSLCLVSIMIFMPMFAFAGRSYYMGFNPWPYDVTSEAQEWTYNTIQSHGDLISHHIEEGVPWEESLRGKNFPTGMLQSLKTRLDRTLPGKKVFLSLNPINPSRNGMALNRGDTPNEPLHAPWNNLALNSGWVKIAYWRYVARMVAMFKPDYLAIGIEVNLLIRNSGNNLKLWNQYAELHGFIYRNLKARYPKMKIFATFDSNAILAKYTQTDNHSLQMKALQKMLPYLDFVGISLHPFFSIYAAEYYPADMFDRIFQLSNKPTVITESSYPAQVWSYQDSFQQIFFNGSPQKQANFVAELLVKAQQYSSPFVVMFAVRDYDPLWEALGKDNFALPWRDTGLFDEQGNPRPALRYWDYFLAQPKDSKY